MKNPIILPKIFRHVRSLRSRLLGLRWRARPSASAWVLRIKQIQSLPKCSMYGIFTYIWVIFTANVGKYCIHGAFGLEDSMALSLPILDNVNPGLINP